MGKTENTVVKLSEYKPLEFSIDNVVLEIDLTSDRTKIINKLFITANRGNAPIFFHGEDLEFKSIKVNEKPLSSNDYKLLDDGLEIYIKDEKFFLEIENFINPSENTALEGIYRSGNIYCTQCEAEGFRRITYFPDRPDNMTKFTTKIIGSKKTEPFLLSNGNLIESGELDDDRHYAIWEDPFLKPSYLFAMVAGDLALVKDSYTTSSGRIVNLEIYVDKGNENKTSHAMTSLKKSMKWDEERYGLEYDLDIYMIVAVDSFNMGAMENKGLNIFNSAYVLASQESATDQNFLGIESVIGHEYFHNWTGNRVTCRDWFQLTLKEGLTVYRDQEFSSDLNSRTVKRIEDVLLLRSHQFSEDDGPNAHPIKPKEYEEINNFYTATIYEKGAEVIRMLETLFGREGFRKGIDKYFELFDGQAVTTEDFLKAMSIANKDEDLSQFQNWYDQKGTPRLYVEFEQSSENKTAKLSFKMFKPRVCSDADWNVPVMPIKLNLIGKSGAIGLSTSDLSDREIEGGFVLLTENERVVTFQNISEEIVPSLNRDFSAPVILDTNLSLEQQLFIISNDDNSFNRYEIAQELMIKEILSFYHNQKFEYGEKFYLSMRSLLQSKQMDDATKAFSLSIPSLGVLFQRIDNIDVQKLNESRKFFKASIAEYLGEDLKAWFDQNSNVEEEYSLNSDQIGKRDLRKVIGSLLASSSLKVDGHLKDHYFRSNNMTDRFNSFSSLVLTPKYESEEIVEDFYERYKDQTLVVQKWISTLASVDNDRVFNYIDKVESLPDFDIKVPNIVRSLVGSFAMRNYGQFHRADGKGYSYVVDKILQLDEINPQIAARLTSAFNIYPKLESSQKEIMRGELSRLSGKKELSKNVSEIINKILG